MFDGKTVTAVFVSLAVIAVVTSGGNIQTPENLGEGGFDIGSLIPSGDLSFENRPEPNNTVEADFSASLENDTLKVYDTNMTSTGLTRIESEQIQSNEPIKLIGYSGDIQISSSGNVKLVGEASGYTTAGVSSMESFEVNATHTSSNIQMDTVRLQHTFNNTEGSITSATNQGSTADKVEFNSFTGNIVLDLDQDDVEMNGKVDRLESGSFVIN